MSNVSKVLIYLSFLLFLKFLTHLSTISYPSSSPIHAHCSRSWTEFNLILILIFFSIPEVTLLKEGLKCDYEPTYCKDHGAIAYATFPTNDDGKCNKKPIMDKDFCEQSFNGTNPAVMVCY